VAELNGLEKFEEEVRHFLEVYKILSPEARVNFEIEIARKTAFMDEKTKKLYSVLIDSAREGFGFSDAIAKMKKIK
jgi:hypothetical protein